MYIYMAQNKQKSCGY